MSKDTFVRISESSDFIEYAKVDYGIPSALLLRKHIPSPQAEFAMELLRHNGILAGLEDGEDTSGRAKYRQELPSELVARAFEIAELTFDAMAERGWFHTNSSIEKMVEACAAEEVA